MDEEAKEETDSPATLKTTRAVLSGITGVIVCALAVAYCADFVSPFAPYGSEELATSPILSSASERGTGQHIQAASSGTTLPAHRPGASPVLDASPGTVAPAGSGGSSSPQRPADAKREPRSIRCGGALKTVWNAEPWPHSDAAAVVASNLPLWPKPRSARWLSGAANGSAWVLAPGFRVDVARPLPRGPQPLLATAARLCPLLWRPTAVRPNAVALLERLEVTVLGGDGGGVVSRVRTGAGALGADDLLATYLPSLQDPQAEAYTLSIVPGEGAGPPRVSARLAARSVAGAMRGLETFAQLFTRAHPGVLVPSGGGGGGGGLVVEDMPAVAWRGLLVDVARHYLPPPLLVATLDAMAAVKLNVLHLHLVDSQSFPLLLDHTSGVGALDVTALGRHGGFPRLREPRLGIAPLTGSGDGEGDGGDPASEAEDATEVAGPHGRAGWHFGGSSSGDGSGGNRGGNGDRATPFGGVYGYSSDELRMIVREAALRGIRIVPEVDVPAHTRSWGAAFPDIVVDCAAATATAQSPTDIPALDPSKNLTFAVVAAVLEAVAEVFPDEYLHLGADEVRLECWREDAALMAWAAAQGLGAGIEAAWRRFD